MNKLGHRLLSRQESDACYADPMRNITASTNAAVDIWPYVDALPLDELGVPSLHDVHYVYRDGRERFDHVLIGTGRFNTLLVVVIDLQLATIHGHFLVDLNEEYGVTGGHQTPVR